MCLLHYSNNSSFSWTFVLLYNWSHLQYQDIDWGQKRWVAKITPLVRSNEVSHDSHFLQLLFDNQESFLSSLMPSWPAGSSLSASGGQIFTFCTVYVCVWLVNWCSVSHECFFLDSCLLALSYLTSHLISVYVCVKGIGFAIAILNYNLGT